MSELKFKRFTLNQRVQHIIFFMSFILLAYTGFPLKFPDEWWSNLMIASVGGFDNRTLIHHISGFVMIGVSIYHVMFHAILEKPRYDILFNFKDVQDFWQQMLYFLKISNDRPKFGRYTWKQKFEYFGAGFGAVIMGFTGILMLNPFESMKYFPIGLVQISGLFHTWEAVLASIAIFIGHMYDEHFGKFPNLSWITGKISEEEMEHEHKLEYDAAIDECNNKNVVNNTDDNNLKSNYISNRLIIALSKTAFTVIFLTVCIWMLWISYYTLLEVVNTYIL
jgi:formate dehydrogenase subunit gamma